MNTPFAAAIAAAAGASPMACGSVPITLDRKLLADGDGLAYYCGGNDDTSVGQAKSNLIAKLDSARRVVGAKSIRILLTESGSNKGHRYAIARVKPYQGQRAGSRRPKNWEYLRELMESGRLPFELETTAVAEADDLFGWWGYNYPDEVVHYTQDKDMRMIPGWHLDWVSHRMHTVGYKRSMYVHRELAPSIIALDSVFNEKQYGPKWFWLQMLHGDGADYIPGLPKYKTVDAKGKPALKPVGEVTANLLLDTDRPYHEVVAELYRGYYGERWLVEMLEQACLLWMRREPAHWDDCLNPGGPLEPFNDGEAEFAKAYFEIEKRVRDADTINATAQAEDNGDSQDAG
jgi:DNA polymerase-1